MNAKEAVAKRIIQLCKEKGYSYKCAGKYQRNLTFNGL